MNTHKYKPILTIITTVVFLILTFIQNSEAIRIINMYPSYGGYEEYRYGGVIYHTTYVRTTAGLDYIDWYVNNGHVSTTMVREGVTEAIFTPHWLKGSLQGVTHTITAVAYSDHDENGDGKPDKNSHSKSYDIKVWEPELKMFESNHTNVSGYIEIRKLYYDSSGSGYAVCDGFIYMHNRSDDETYNIADWGARLSCYSDDKVLAPDRKKHVRGGTLSPGQIFYEPIALSMDLGARGAKENNWYTMQADYWINLSTGEDHEVDPLEFQQTYDFEYEGPQ